MRRTTRAAHPERGRRALAPLTALAAVTALLSGCAAGGTTEAAQTPEPAAEAGEVAATPEEEGALAGTLELTSPDLAEGNRLPAWATGTFPGFCGGENTSPTLTWTGAPAGTAGYVLFLVDDASSGFVHWVVTGIAGDVTGLEPAPEGQVDSGVVGSSLAGPGEYIGPCAADRQYRYLLFALDEAVTLRAGSTMSTVLQEVDGHVLDVAELPVVPTPVEG